MTVRRVLGSFVSLAAGAALLGPGLARADMLKHNPDVVKTTLHRSVFDQVGPQVNVPRLCGTRGARQVEVRRNAWQAVVSVLTIGFYTPTTARVLCNTPGAEGISQR